MHREQLHQVVRDFGEPVKSWSAACPMESVTASPERGLNGMELSPTPGTFAIDLCGLDKDVQRAVDSPARVVRFQKRQRA